jgi:hypothetical protein
MDKQGLFLLILGMHRSGTSCLAGALERCGLFLGNVRRTGVHNKKGYFELKILQQVHDEILALNGVSWSAPKPVEYVGEYGSQIKHIVNELTQQPYCGVKDPRILFLLDHWRQTAGENCQLAGTFRHPVAVARSLSERNGFSLEEGLDIWIKYNAVLVEEHKKAAFPLIHYDLSEKANYISDIKNIATHFGLRPSNWKLKLFVSSRLEHHKYSIDDIPGNCKYLYEYLMANRFAGSH